MFQVSAPRLSNVHRGLLLGLSLSAAAGWGCFAVSRHSSGEVERKLSDQVASLQERQTQLLAERTKTQVSLSEMARLRAELATARSEVNRLSQLRQDQAVLPPVRPDAKENLLSSKSTDDVSATGSVGVKAIRPQPVKAVSGGKPLPHNRDGQPAAVKIAAQSLLTPGEKAQRRKAQAAATELDTAGLRQLTKSAEASTPE
jgi:hypothetical protein